MNDDDFYSIDEFNKIMDDKKDQNLFLQEYQDIMKKDNEPNGIRTRFESDGNQ